MMERTKVAIKNGQSRDTQNGQSRDTGNINGQSRDTGNINGQFRDTGNIEDKGLRTKILKPTLTLSQHSISKICVNLKSKTK